MNLDLYHLAGRLRQAHTKLTAAHSDDQYLRALCDMASAIKDLERMSGIAGPPVAGTRAIVRERLRVVGGTEA